jgi:hypothetical protein
VVDYILMANAAFELLLAVSEHVTGLEDGYMRPHRRPM